jgi:hypothetical protein
MEQLLSFIGALVSFPVAPLGNVTIGTVVWAVGAVVALACNLSAWVEARIDLAVFKSARARYGAFEWSLKLRQLERNTRNDEIAIEAQGALLSAALLAGLAQHLEVLTIATQRGPFVDFAPLLFALAEFHMAYGSLQNLIDRQNDDRSGALRLALKKDSEGPPHG